MSNSRSRWSAKRTRRATHIPMNLWKSLTSHAELGEPRSRGASRLSGGPVHKWAAIIAVGVVVFGGLTAVDAVNAPQAAAATITVPPAENVQARMDGHIGYTAASPGGSANAAAGDDYRYGSAGNGTTSGSIGNSGGSAGSSGSNYSNGNTAYLGDGNTVWSAHGGQQGSGRQLNLSGQSALGFSPRGISTVQTGEIFNLGRVSHQNNPVTVTNQYFRGDLDIRFLTMDLSYTWQMNETPNQCNGNNCADDFTTFLNQLSPQTFVHTDGLTYTLVVQGFVSPQGSNNTCNATVPSISGVINQFRTVENQTTYGCLYASIEQVRQVTVNKVVASPYTTAPARTFAFTSSSTLAGSPWASNFSLTDGSSVVRPYNSGESLTITEGAQADPWAFTSVACVDGTGSAIPGITVSGQSITIPRGTTATTANASDITCTYTNTYTPRATVTLVKQVTSTGQQAPVAQPAHWTLNAQGQGVVSSQLVTGPGNSATVTNQSVIAGTYRLGEVANNPSTTAGYVQNGPWTCTNGVTVNANSEITLTHGQSTTCTVRNLFQTGTLEITKTVTSPANGYTQGTAKPFTAQYSCSVAGGTPITGQVTINPAATNGNAGAVASIPNLPAGASCTVTELNAPTGTSTDLTNGSYVWGSPVATPGSTVLITANAATRVNLTNPVTQNTGSLVISKQVTPRAGVPSAGYTGGNRTFAINYSCVIGGATTASGVRNVAAGSSVTVTGIPATSVCTLSETQSAAAGDFADASYRWDGTSFTQPAIIPANGESAGTVVNYFTRDLATLTIAKTVQGDGYTGGDFTINYACGQGDSAVTGSVVIAHGESEQVQVPSGVACTVVETADRPGLAPGYVWQDATYAGLTNGSVTATIAQPATVTVTNPTAIGFNRISVTKQIANYAADVSPGTTFDVTVACNQPAQGEATNYSGVFTFTTPLGGAQQTPYLPIGTSCTVVETALPSGSDDLPGASYSWSSTPVYVGLTDGAITVPASTTPASATVINDVNRVYGALNITKEVVNNASIGLSAPFSGTWACTFGGEPHASGTWTVPASGGAATLTSTVGNHEALLVGSTCSVDEAAPENPVPGDNSYVWAVTLPADILPVTVEGTSATVTNTITRTTGSFSVAKNVIGGTAGEQFEAADFTFDYVCEPPSGADITGTIGVAAGATGDGPDGVPAGSVCTVTERTGADLPAPIDPYRWDGVTFDVTGASGTPVTDGITFTTPADGAAVAVSATNSISARTGSVSVNKTVTQLDGGFVGGTSEIFPMTLTCTDPATGSSAQFGATQTIANDGTATWNDIPIGLVCSVQESAILAGGLKDASFAWAAPAYSHPDGVTVLESDTPTMTVTNSMVRVYGEIYVAKIFDDGGFPAVVAGDRTYSGAWSCSYDGGTVAAGTWTGTGSSAGTVATLTATTGSATEVLLTSSCTVTEDTLSAPSASDSSFYWLDPVLLGVTSVNETPSANQMTVTNELARNTGSVTVAKTLSGADGYVGDGFAGFPVGIACALDPADIDNELAVNRMTGTATVLPGAAAVTLINDVPRGWTCAVNEGAFSGGLYDGSYAWGDETITVDGEETTSLTIAETPRAVVVDNNIVRLTGSIEIEKQIAAGLEHAVSDGATFSGAYSCIYDEGTPREETFSGTWSVTDAGDATLVGDTVLPLGTVCDVTEETPNPADLVDVSWAWGTPVVAPQSATVTANGPASFTVTNTPQRVYSTVEITKELVGPSTGFANPALTVAGTWSCTYGGAVVATGRWTAPAAGGAATLDPANPQIPLTSQCESAEDTLDTTVFVDESYVWGAQPAVQTADVVAGEPASMTFVNTVERVYGTFAITKQINRGAGVSDLVPSAGIEYSGTYACSYGGVEEAPKPWTIVGTGTFTAPDAYYVGTQCRIVDENAPSAPVPGDASYQWAGHSFSSPVTLGANPAVATATVWNSVMRVTGEFSVTKAFQGDASGLLDADPFYSFEWSCVADNGDVFPAAGANNTFAITAGGTWSPADEDLTIPTGSECTVTETGVPAVTDPSYTWSTAMSISGATGTANGSTMVFETPADADAAVLVTATNTLSREMGSYTVRKDADPVSGSTVMPGDTITYTVTVTPGAAGFVDDVVVTDDLSAVLPYATLDEATITATQGATDVVDNSLVWTVGRVNVGEPLTLTYQVTVNADQWGIELRNSVTTTGENPPEECEQCSTVHYTPAWEISKTSDPASGSAVVAGTVITYTLTAVNTTANATVTGATATDDLAGVLAYAELGTLPDSLTNDGGVLTWAIPTLAPGESTSVSYAVTVLDGFDGVTFNNGVVPGDGGECVESCTTTHHTPAWTLAKSSDPASGTMVLAGEEVTYTLTITNTGPVAVPAASAQDDLSDVLAHADLVEPLPAGLTLDGTTLTWNAGAIAVDGSVSVSYTVVVHDDARGVTLRNVVVPTGPGGECEGSCTTEHPVPAWSLTKTSDPASGTAVVPGQEVTYTLTVTNTGQVATSVTAQDDLTEVLAHAALVGALPDELTLDGNTLTWDAGTVAAGASVSVSYTVVVNDDARGVTLRNVVVPTSPGGECVEACTTEHPVPAWTLMKTSDPASGSTVLPGDEVTYTLTITNPGPVPTVATAEDDLSAVLAHADIVGALPDELTLDGTTLTWNAGTIEVGDSVSVSYTVVVHDDARGVTLRNVVVPTSPGGQCVEACTTEHPVPAWTLTKTSDPASGSTVVPGQEVTYTLTIENTGPTVVDSATAEDDLSDVLAHADLVEPLPAGLTLDGTTLTWNADAIAVDGSVSVSYTVVVHDDARGVTLRNVVVPTSPGGECEGSCTTEHPVPAWSLTKTSDPATGTTVLPGQEVTYTLTVTNTGPVATAVTAQDDLTDVLAHADLVGDLPDGLTLDGTTLTWDAGTIAAGDSVSVSYTVAVHEDARGVTLRNVVVPTSPGGECEGDCTTENPVPAWSLTKTSDPASGSTVLPGQEVTYTLTVTNTGPVATTATAEDDLSEVLAHADLVGELPAGATLDGTTLTWNTATIGVGESVSISYTVVVHADALGETLRNVVVPTGPGGECEGSCTTEHPVPAWSLTKTSDPASGSSVLPGDEVTYTLTIENTGPVAVEATAQDDLTEVLAHADLVSELPAGLTLDGMTLTWNAGTIGVGESVSVSYTVVVHADARGATLRNVVVPTTPGGECEVSCTTDHLVPAWSLTKSSDPASGSSVKPGEHITYTLTATNIGEANLTGALAIDDLSGVLEHATLAGDLPAGLTLSGETLTWQIPDLAPGATASVSYIVTVKADAKGVTIKNVVTPGGTPGGDCVESCSTDHEVPTPPVKPPLPATGSANTLPWGLAGGFALMVGAALIFMRRNRREMQD